MSLERLQRHFQEEPLKYVGRGSEVKVYGTSKAVVKEWDPLPSTPAEKVTMDRAALPQIKAGMGGLVLPFESADKIDGFQIQGKKWFFCENRVPLSFTNPVIQERVSASTFLDRVMATSSVQEESHYLDLVLAWTQVAISRGFFAHDLVSTNFVVSGGGILLADMGAVHGTYSGRRNTLRNKDILGRFAHNAAASYSPFVRDASILTAFKRRLGNILSTAVHKIPGKPSEAYPVPDLSL